MIISSRRSISSCSGGGTRGRTVPASVGIDDVRRALDESPPFRTDHHGVARDIAEYLTSGAVTRVRGGGDGFEAEYTYLMTISDQNDLNQLARERAVMANERAVLAYGPGRMFSVTLETKNFFQGRDGRYYRTKDAAESAAGGTAITVKFAMPEFVSDVTRTFRGESGYYHHGPVFMALSRLEQSLERLDLPGAEGSLPDIPLSQVLPEDFELTDLGRRILIGPRPVGDWPGAHLHRTFGVPLTGLYLFLEHVRDHTWRDESRGYLTRAHLADGLEFGRQIAFQFIADKYFPGRYRPPGFLPEDELARRCASESAVAQLRGYAALLYTGAATVAHSLIYKGLGKVNAAVLSRHDMGHILAALPPEVRDYLRRNADDIINRFERSFQNRIPDYDDQFRNRNDELGLRGPVTISKPTSPENYLLGGLDPARALERSQKQYMNMATLPGLDTRHHGELGFALIVLEVRSYGARHVSAADARVQHERLAAVVRQLGVRDREIALVASVRQVIRESLARHPATLRLTLAWQLVITHGRPGAIWQDALDFLRAEPEISSRIMFVEDAWRDPGQPWNLIPLPAGIRHLLGVDGPTVITGITGSRTAGRLTHARPGQVPGPVAVTFPEGRSGGGDIPNSLELAALARWLAEAGAAHGASTPHGRPLPQVQITGYGNGRSLDPTDNTARQTGQRRADTVHARLLASVRHYLRQLGADPAIADAMLPAGQATGASGRNLPTREAARRALATVPACPDAGIAARGVAGGHDPGQVMVVATPSGFYLPGGPALDSAAGADERAAAAWFPPVTGAQVWHLHLDPGTGRVLTGDRVLTPDQFYDQVMAARQSPAGTVLVLVGCGAAVTAPGAAESAAQVLARRSGGPVLAAGTDAWSTPDGRVLAAPAGVDAEGRPVLGSTPGNWVLVPPDGQPSAGLGPDLLDIVRRGTLPAGLLNGIQPPEVTDGGDRPRPARSVRWAQSNLPGAAATGARRLDQLSDLIAAVRRNLRGLNWPGDLADDEVIRVYERLKDDPATGRGTAAQANYVAQYIANDASPVRMRGGGSGVEAEYTYLMTIDGQPDLDQVLREVLAYGPGRTFSVTVDTKEYFHGGDGRYYRTEDAAESATGMASEVKFAMPEFVSDVTRTFPGESGYLDHVPVFEGLSRLEQVLADLPGEQGSTPGIPLSAVLRPEDGFELTDLGRRTVIGPRPVGDGLGAHVHHTFGVPLTGLYLFLEHVRDNTWRDESRGYLTRAHLADGLEFGGQIASRFIADTYFPAGYRPAGFSAADELARRTASEPAVAALRGYAALLYTGAATVANESIYGGHSKENAAVLARHDMGQILAALPPEVRDYLRRNADDIMSGFERSFRNRIPDYDDQFRKHCLEDTGWSGPTAVDLLRPLLDLAQDDQDRKEILLLSPANYLLGGLDPDKALEASQDQYMAMSTLPDLDTRHQQELGFALVVLEVRSYGARHVSAADARAQHERLAAVVRELGVRDQEIALVASVRQVIRESLARNSATLQLTLAAPLVNRHGPRPGAIWQAALDFLRAEPAITSQIRFVEDAWREDGQQWNLIPLPAGTRQLLAVGGPTLITGSSRADRQAHASPDLVAEPVAVTFPEGRSGEGDIPGSLELAALARWLAEEGAAHGASTPHGRRLPQVQITGFGNGRRFDSTGESARRTGQRRADAVRARLLASVRDYLGQLGADPAIADAMLPAGQATGASGRNLATREAARRAVATAQFRPDGRELIDVAEPEPDNAELSESAKAALLAEVINTPAARFEVVDNVEAAASAPGEPQAHDELAAGWQWLDQARTIAIPNVTGDTRTDPAEWRVAQGGEGRDYAVHLRTGWIAARIQTDSGLRFVLHELTNGWVHDGADLVHQTTGAVLHDRGATIGTASPARLYKVRQQVRSQDPAVRDQARQLNRDDLLTWLLDHRGLAGPVPGIVTGPGWQQLAVQGGAIDWVWNSPGVRAHALPPGLHQGSASGHGMACLLDSLRQLMDQRLPEHQRDEMTVESLRAWLIEQLPEGNEARTQLQHEDQVDVWRMLPVFTDVLQVRVQVFEQPAGQGMLPHRPIGPAADEQGIPTPVLRLHWTGVQAQGVTAGHFTPVFERAQRAHLQTASTSTQPLGGVDDILRRRVRLYLEDRKVGHSQHEVDLLADVLGQVEGQAGGVPDEGWNRRISDGLALLPTYFGEQSYTTELPDIDAAGLRQGDPITVYGLIRAHMNSESLPFGAVRYVIERSTAGRDLSGLVDVPPDLVLFDRGQQFEVVRVRAEDGRCTIVLQPPRDREPDAPPVLSTATDLTQTTTVQTTTVQTTTAQTTTAQTTTAQTTSTPSAEEEYVAGSGLMLPEGISRAGAVAALRRVAEQAGYRGAQAMPAPQADSLLLQGLRLLGGFAGLRLYASVPAEALSTRDGAGELFYQRGRVIQSARLTLGWAEPGEMPAGQVRVVIFPRPAGGHGGARDAGWLLGAGAVVFGPGTRFEVVAVDQVRRELSWRELADAAAPAPAPEVAARPVTAAPFGLARPEMIAAYADDIARRATAWERLWEPERVFALQIAVNAALARIGVPPVRVSLERSAGAPARFVEASWQVLLAPDELADLWQMAMVVYREARRAEQMSLMVRLQQGTLAEGSPEHAAARVWLGSRQGAEAAAVEESVRGPLREAVRDAQRQLWELADRLSAEQKQISEPAERDRHAEEAQAALASHERDVAAARDEYEHQVMRRYRDLPAGFDALMLQARVRDGLNPGAVPVEDHRYLAPGEAPSLRPSRAVSDRVNHLWLGLRRSPVVEALLPVLPGHGVVIHGWGEAGRLVADGGVVDLAGVYLPPADVVVLAHDAHLSVQELATARRRPVWAPDGPVWVSLGTGAVFFGDAEVGPDGLLRPAPDGRVGQLVRYAQGGGGQPVPLAAGERPPVLRVLTGGQAAADPGPWQLRGRSPRQLVRPVGGPGQAEAEAFGEDLNDRVRAEAEDAALEDRHRRAAEKQAADPIRIPGGMVSAGPRWHSRFGGLIGAGRAEPGRFVLGLEVGPEGRLALWAGRDAYVDLDAKYLEGLPYFGWVGEDLLVITERRPFDEVDEQLAELAEALGVGISVDPRFALPGPAGPDPDRTELSESAGPGDAGVVGRVAGALAGFRIVEVPVQDGVVDLRPVIKLFRNERVLGLVEAFLGMAPGTLIGAPRPVRIVVAAMPAGSAGDAVIRRLWDEFAGSARVAFAPGAGAPGGGGGRGRRPGGRRPGRAAGLVGAGGLGAAGALPGAGYHESGRRRDRG